MSILERNPMFAKLFGPDENQILVVFETNDEGRPTIYVTTEHDGMLVKVAPSWEDSDSGWDKAEKAFAEMDEAKARQFVKPTIDFMSQA